MGLPSDRRSTESVFLLAAWKRLANQRAESQSYERHGNQRRRAGSVKPAVAVAMAILLGIGVTAFGPQFLLTDGFTRLEAAPGQGGSGEQGTVNGQQLVARSARHLLAESSIRANVRFRVDGFGHQVIGVGSYLQLGDGPEKLLRFELKSQVGDQTATVQEVCSEDDYWVRRDLPQLGTSVGRAALRPIRQGIAKRGKDPNVDPIESWIVLGGLPRMMEELNRNFEFGEGRATEVEFTSADGKGIDRLPVWMVEGEWKPERLNYLTGGKTPADLSKLPEQFPTKVELILGRVDQVFPLFPYRITFQRPRANGPSDADRPTDRRSMTSLCTLEFFGVYHTSDIDPREFAYDPGDQEVADLTGQFMNRLGLAGK